MTQDCQHEEFEARVEVGRITDLVPMGFTADATIHCARCGTPFEFIGLPIGMSPHRPMLSFDRREARMPIKPLGQIKHGAGMSFSITKGLLP